MRILILPSWYPDENDELNGIFFKEQAEALNKKGIDISVLSINIVSLSQIINGKFTRGLNVSVENGVKVYRYYTYNYFPRMTELYLRYYGKLIKRLINKIIMEESTFDLVHIHSAIDAGIAYSISKIKIPYVITEHSTKYERDILNSVQKKNLYNVFQNSSKVLVVGAGLKKAVSQYISANKIEILPNMVALNKIGATKDDNKSRFRFFSLGFLTKKKGMDLLIEAFSRNKKNLLDCELYIGGDGEEFDNLQNQINSLGLQDRIKLLGKLSREAVAYHMNNCDSFVLASRFETFGIVFLEAMIYGRPVIGTKTGGPDTFINEDIGILVDVEDIDELGKALVMMYNKAGQYDGDLISKYCYDRFSETAICNRLIKIYDDILK